MRCSPASRSLRPAATKMRASRPSPCRTAPTACAAGGCHLGLNPSVPDLFPDGSYRGLQLGSRPGRTAEPPGHGEEAAAQEVSVLLGRASTQAQPAVRAQLQYFSGPVPFRQAGRGLMCAASSPTASLPAPTLRRQQPGAAPHGVGLRRRRAKSLRELYPTGFP